MKIARMPCPGSPLDVFANNVTSQFGEDGILARLAELLNPPKVFVEFGAWDGVVHSNCRQLALAGWSGLMIEADAERCASIADNYHGRDVRSVNRMVGFEGEDRLDVILRENDVPASVGLMSIDVDGADYHIWQALERYTPEIVVVEFNPTIPNDVVFVQARSLDVNQGSSLLALAFLGQDKGYELAAVTAANAIFVRVDKFSLTGITDNSLSTLHRPMCDGRIFHGYDGTIHVVGMHDLLWHHMKLSPEDHQVLPKAARVFSGARQDGVKA